MKIREQILSILKKRPNLSSSEIGKLIGKHKQTVIYHLKKLDIKRDRNFIRKQNNTNRSYSINITEKANQLVLGSILGDGCISKNCRVKNSKLNSNSKLSIKHSLNQKEYVKYKEKLFTNENIIIHYSEIKIGKRKPCFIKGRLLKDNGSSILDTQKNIVFNIYRDLFYINYKIVPDKIYELNSLGLSIWFMDDGSKHSSSYYLHTDGFDIKCQKKLLNMLYVNFNIKGTLHKTRTNYNIYIKAESCDLFTKLVEPHICDSMLYKLHNRVD